MQLEDFQIGSLVFQDVLGKTHNARRRNTGESVHLKILHPTHNKIPHFSETFKGNLATATLENHHVARVLAYEEGGYSNFVVSEVADLVPLEVLLSEGISLSIIEYTAFIHKVASAIRSVHIDGKVHGALSPQTIFTDRKLGQVQIGSWGFEDVFRLLLAHQAEELRPVLPYLSPEMTTHSVRLQRQSDIYSMGVLYYRLLVGNTPWQGTDLGKFYHSGERLPVIPPSLQRLEIPELLDTVIQNALELDVACRCPNMSMFIKSLSEARTDLLASFTPTSSFLFEAEPVGGKYEEIIDTVEKNGEAKPAVSSNRVEPHLTDDIVDAPAQVSAAELPPSSHDEFEKKTGGNATNNGHSSEQGSDYKQQLLAHEGDFFADLSNPPSSEPEPPAAEVTKGPDAKTAGNGQAASGTITLESLDLMVDQSPLPGPQKTELKQLEVKQEGDAAEISANRPFTNLQAEEFDDGGAVKAPIASSAQYGNRPVQRSTPIPIRQPVPGNINRPDQNIAPQAPPQTYHDNDVSFLDEEDFDERTATQTQDFATTNTVDLKRVHSGWSVNGLFKTAALTVLPLTFLLLIVIYAFNLKLEVPGGAFWQSWVSSQPVESIARRAESPLQKKSAAVKRRSPNVAKGTTQSATRQRSGSKPVNSQNKAILKKGQSQPVRQVVQKRQRNLANGRAIQKNQILPSAQAVNATVLDINVVIASGDVAQIADVYLDGRLLGSTNGRGRIDILNLKPNRGYLLKVKKAGFKMWAREVSFPAGGRRSLSVQLEPVTQVQKSVPAKVVTADRNNVLEKNIGPQKMKPLSKQASRKTTSKTVGDRNSQAAYGIVDIVLDNVERLNDVYIYVNGALWNGQNYTAPAQVQLPAGTYMIEIRKEGYFSAPASRSVNILNGETETLHFILTAQ